MLVRLEPVEAADLLSTRMEDTSTTEVVGIDVDAVEITPPEAVELDERADRSWSVNESRARYLLTAVLVVHRVFGRKDLLAFLIQPESIRRRSRAHV